METTQYTLAQEYVQLADGAHPAYVQARLGQGGLRLRLSPTKPVSDAPGYAIVGFVTITPPDIAWGRSDSDVLNCEIIVS